MTTMTLALSLASTAAARHCGSPLSRGEEPTIGDALFVLHCALGTQACLPCEADVDGSGQVRVSDSLAILRATLGGPVPTGCPACRPPNFVVLLTDDQRADSLWCMENLQELVVAKGVNFTSAYSITAECCPFRAGFLAGGYAPASTGVKDGNPLNGGMSHFRDVDTLPRRLQAAGYRTGLVGKYLHGHSPGYVPPGWSRFVSTDTNQFQDFNNLKNITYGSSTTAPTAGTVVKSKVQYLTDFHRDEALAFLDTVEDDEPFFLYVGLVAPHWPATPAPEDAALFSDFRLEGPWYDEADISDKPQWVRDVDLLSGPGPKTGNAIAAFRTLQSVDRLLRDVHEEIAARGLADDTYFVFLSDNGLMWGEHRLVSDKGMPYEESVRVPLVISGPAVKPGAMGRIVGAELDVPATILDLAGLDAPQGCDGESLLPFLRGASRPWRTELLIENYSYLESARLAWGPAWAGLRADLDGRPWKYVEYGTGERELYDLRRDPHEMENIAERPASRAVRQALRDKLEPLRGLAILTRSLAAMTVGVDYEQRLETWGGTSPFAWSVVAGKLPPGIVLGAAGTVRGRPTTPGTYTFTVRVTDSDPAAHSLAPEEFRRVFTVSVAP